MFGRFVQLLGDPIFLGHAATTLYRLFWGFGLAVVVGVGLGIAAAGSPTVGALLRPLIRVLAPVPKIALYPAFILTLGFDHSSKIALVFADALFPILLATYQGAISVEPKLVWSARAMGVSRLKMPVHGGADGGAALDPDRLPDQPCHFLHRGLSVGDDILD